MFKVTEKSRSLKLYNIELINNYIKILLSLSGMMVIIGISKPSIYDHINVVVVASSLFIATGTWIYLVTIIKKNLWEKTKKLLIPKIYNEINVASEKETNTNLLWRELETLTGTGNNIVNKSINKNALLNKIDEYIKQ